MVANNAFSIALAAIHCKPRSTARLFALAVIEMTNADDGTPELFVDRAQQYVGPLIAKATARDEKRAPDAAWQRYEGRYRNRWGDLQVLLVNDGLLLIEPSLPDPMAMATRPHRIEGRDHTFRADDKDGYGSHGEAVAFELGGVRARSRWARAEDPLRRELHRRRGELVTPQR